MLNLSPENRRLFAKRQRENRASPTPAESHVKALLEQLKERFIFEKGVFTETRFFIVDFYLPKPRKICLEIDGEYHKRRMALDRAKDMFLTLEKGMRVIRIPNGIAFSLDAAGLLAILNKR